MAKKTNPKVVPMTRRISGPKTKPAETAKKDAAELPEEVQRALGMQAQEIDDAHREVGQLLVANRRQERMIRELMQRLSKYESVETSTLLDDEGGGK